MGLLISAPSTRFPRGGPEASSALGAAGSEGASLSLSSLRAAAKINRVPNQPKVLQHTFSNFAKCVAIFFIF